MIPPRSSAPRNAIPHVIHQTWKTAEVPERFVKYQRSWIDAHPEWGYQLWTDEDNLALIEREFPWFLPTYFTYPYEIQRVDAARYFILLSRGGLYADLDFECLRPFDDLLAEHTCVLGLEPNAAAVAFGRPRTVSNALIASVPGHPMLAAITSRLGAYHVRVPLHARQLVLETTGPFMLTEVYDSLSEPKYVTLMPASTLFPLTMQEADLLRGLALREPVPDLDLAAARERLASAHAVHHHYGTWWRNE